MFVMISSKVVDNKFSCQLQFNNRSKNVMVAKSNLQKIVVKKVVYLKSILLKQKMFRFIHTQNVIYLTFCSQLNF